MFTTLQTFQRSALLAIGLAALLPATSAFAQSAYSTAKGGIALAIARRAGLTIEQFHAVVGSGRMRSGFYDTFIKWSREGDENAHRFTISNAHKDMRYLASMANEIGAVNNLQALVKNDFAAMEAAGQGQRYVPMLADFIAQANGLPAAVAERGAST